MKKPEKGFTLIELVIAIALSAVVLLSVSNLLISFGNFSTKVIKGEASLMGTALGTLEEIIAQITVANKVAIPSADANMDVPSTPYPAGCAGSACIQIRVDTADPITPSDYSDDTVYTYWKSGSQLFRSVTGGPAAGSVIAEDLVSLSFTKTPENQIKISLEAQVTSGPHSDPTKNKTKEFLETTVTLRSRSAA